MITIFHAKPISLTPQTNTYLNRFFLICILLLIFTTSCVHIPYTPNPTSIPIPTKPPLPTIIQPTETIIQPTLTSVPPTKPGITPTNAEPGTLEPTPFTALRNPYAVGFVPKGEVLYIRKPAGSNNPQIGHFSAETHNINLTGNTTLINNQIWAEVPIPVDNTSGWVNTKYLTEYISANEFCVDKKVNGLIENLKFAIINLDSGLFSTIVSPIHGLDVYYFHNGNLANYNRSESKFVFESNYMMDWGTHPASGETIKGTFHDIVLPQLQVVLTSSYTLGCNDLTLGPHSYFYQWPGEYGNINYYALLKPGTEQNGGLDWRTWLAGVEYVNGEPYLVTLVHLFWEP